MTSADEENQLERLLVQYQRVEEVLYGSVYPLQVDTSQVTGEITLGTWEAPFVVSKQVGEHEIIYGSVLHHIYEASRPFFQMEVLQKKLRESLPVEIRSSLTESRSGNRRMFTAPASEFSSLFLYQQDQIIKDAVLLSAPAVRTLVEVFNGKGNPMVATYDYEGSPIGEVSMQQLFNALDHHRYCVVSGGFIHDIFSDEDTRGLPNLFGTKINVSELLTTVADFLEGITVNDFTGMLRRRWERLTVDSKPRDIIFVHQNIYALTEIVRARLGDTKFPFLDYLFSQFTAEENQRISAAVGKDAVILKRQFTAPRFKIGPDLDAKVIEMGITINGEHVRFEYSQQEFFEALTSTCGNEVLVPFERLRRRFDDLGDLS